MPQIQTIIELAMSAAEGDDAECARHALELLSTTELSNSAKNLFMDEGGMYYLLSSAARAASPNLSAQAWSILRNSLRGTDLPSPASYLARIHALASAGDFDNAFATLRELESLVGKSPQAGDREILSPFSSLRPLVLACTRGGFAALDAVRLSFPHIKQLASFGFFWSRCQAWRIFCFVLGSGIGDFLHFSEPRLR